MKIKKYVHSTVELEMGGKKILIDPGKYNFGGSRFELEHLDEGYFQDVDLLLLTHTHADHYEPETVTRIYNSSRPKIISNKEVGDDLQSRNIEHVVLEEGQETTVEGLKIKAYPCDHIVPSIGFLIDDGKQSAYFVSDTLYEKVNVYADVAFVPIGNRGLVMDPKEAAKFTSEINPGLVIPVHYESPKDEVNPEEFVNAMEEIGCAVPVKILGFKESIDYG